MKKRIVLTPQYMKQFQCAGNCCEDNCCYGWIINIDENTYKKYRKVSQPTFRALFDKNIKRNRSNPSTKNYAKINKCLSGYCPFLGEDKFCDIQKKLGVNYLSNTCTTYPRITNIVNGIYEKSLTVSCPEAARLVLLNPGIIEFDETEETAEIQNNIINQIDTDNIKFTNSITRYFWQLRIFSISLIQNRKYSIADRLIILGLFTNKVQEYLNKNRVHEIPEIIEEYNRIIENDDLKEALKDIPSNLTIQMELMKEFSEKRFSSILSENCKPYLECILEFYKGIKYTAEARVEDIGENYKKAYLNFYKPYMRNHEYIMENYVVNLMFRKLFPISFADNVFENYMELIIHYALIKMFLIGISSFHKKLDEALIIKLVYSFSRAIEHSPKFWNENFKLFKENGYDTMAYMAILIKN